MDINQKKRILRIKRQKRVRVKIQGTPRRPRLSVYRSNTSLSAQVIDDTNRKTLFTVSISGKNIDAAQKLGQLLIKASKDKKISELVFDRGGYKYRGSIKALAESIRQAGVKI